MPRGRRNSDGSTVGGKRPNAGRKPGDSERFFIYLHRETRVKVDRFAKTHGLKRTKGSRFWDAVLTILMENVDIPKPEYLQFIPAERMRMLSAHTAE